MGYAHLGGLKEDRDTHLADESPGFALDLCQSEASEPILGQGDSGG